MCFYAYKNVLEPMGHLGANLIFSILTLNQVLNFAKRFRYGFVDLWIHYQILAKLSRNLPQFRTEKKGSRSP